MTKWTRYLGLHVHRRVVQAGTCTLAVVAG